MLPSSFQETEKNTTDLISHLANYPLLGELFDGKHPNALAEMKTNLTNTCQQLDQVVRRGPAEDSKIAQAAIDSYKITLALLDELEKMYQARQNL